MSDQPPSHIQFTQAYIQNLFIEQKSLSPAQSLPDYQSPIFSRPPNPVPSHSAPPLTPIPSHRPSERLQPNVAQDNPTWINNPTTADAPGLLQEDPWLSLMDDIWSAFQRHGLSTAIPNYMLQTRVSQLIAGLRIDLEQTAAHESNETLHRRPGARLYAQHDHIPLVPIAPVHTPPQPTLPPYYPAPQQNQEIPAASTFSSPVGRTLSSLSLQLQEFPSPVPQPSCPTNRLSAPAYHVIPPSPVWTLIPTHIPDPNQGASSTHISIGSRHGLAPLNREHGPTSANYTFPLTASSSFSPAAPPHTFQQLPQVPVSPTPTPRRRPPSHYSGLLDNRFPILED